MDSDDDLELFAPTEQPSPVPERKLKRLKKAVKASTGPVRSPASGDSPSTIEVNLSTSQSPNLDESNEDQAGSRLKSEGSKENNELSSVSSESDAQSEKSDNLSRSGSESEGSGNENELNSGFDGLGGEENGVGAKRALQFDSVGEEEDGKGEERSGELEDEGGEAWAEGSEKKRRSFEELADENGKKKKKKRVKSTEDDEKWNSFGPSMNMTAKERREHLKQLHAESQRLLRETRDASFNPIPLVQKPISSILEKIRKRRMEISKKSVIFKNDSQLADGKGLYGDGMVDSNPEDGTSHRQEESRTEEVVIKETIVKHVETRSVVESFDALPVDGLDGSANNSSHDDIPNQMDVDEDSKQAFRAPIDDTQELFSDSQGSDTDKQPSNGLPNSPLEEVLAPSLLAMNLKLDSALPDEVSDYEEEIDKENVHPYLHRQTEVSSSPKGDPVKAFLDDEAEEEDDSDNDQLIFQDNEEDEDNGDSEELNDIIATGFKEKPIDNEIRNELHQKWLEQQDAMGTENLLQRLKYGSKEPEARLLQEDSGDDDDDDDKSEEDAELDGEADEDLVPKDLIRTTLKKVKQMIPLMFTDEEDPYLSSDDDETEKRIVKQCLHEKSEEKAVFLSPAEDVGCKEVFGLIKKMNVLPDPKRKVKSSTPFDMPLVGRNGNSSSKSSFIGRGAGCSLPSSNKGSKVRSFIFGREDSNSRTSVISEDSLDKIQREKLPTRAPAKFSGSQCKSSTQSQNQKTKTAPETNTGHSLFEVLRRSTLQSNKRTESTTFSQNESIFASFRLPKKPVK